MFDAPSSCLLIERDTDTKAKVQILFTCIYYIYASAQQNFIIYKSSRIGLPYSYSGYRVLSIKLLSFIIKKEKEINHVNQRGHMNYYNLRETAANNRHNHKIKMRIFSFSCQIIIRISDIF